MSGMSLAAGSVISGGAASGGAVLAMAGAGKLYRGIVGREDMTAIRRALQMPPRSWRLFGLAAGGTECVAGAVVCSGRFPVAGGAALAALGAVFCALLGYVQVRKIPGGCGCIGWRPASGTAASGTAASGTAASGTAASGTTASGTTASGTTASGTTAQAPAGRAVIRGAVLLGAGLADAVAGIGAPRLFWWFGAGAAAGMAVLVLLSRPDPVRTPVCGRPLWRRTSATLRALASHETFAAMAGSAGPFGPVVRYRRLGCTDEFWFTVPPEHGPAQHGPAQHGPAQHGPAQHGPAQHGPAQQGLPDQGSRAVVFRVRWVAPGARLAVHTSLRDVTAPNVNWPARAIAGRWRETL